MVSVSQEGRGKPGQIFAPLVQVAWRGGRGRTAFADESIDPLGDLFDDGRGIDEHRDFVIEIKAPHVEVGRTGNSDVSIDDHQLGMNHTFGVEIYANPRLLKLAEVTASRQIGNRMIGTGGKDNSNIVSQAALEHQGVEQAFIGNEVGGDDPDSFFRVIEGGNHGIVKRIALHIRAAGDDLGPDIR